MARRQARASTPAAQPAPGVPEHTRVSSADMDGHMANGRAVPLSQVIPFIIRYENAWWLSTQAGWLPIAPSIAAVLDKHAERMRQHDAVIAANQATIRTVIDRARQADIRQDQSPT
jgi:hypothetical protein